MAFQIDISSEESFKSEVLDASSGLQVVELYQGWCGPCKAVINTWKTKVVFGELSDRPIKFLTVNVEKVAAMQKECNGCEPVFLFYKNGKIVDRVVGVQAPPLVKLVTTLSVSAC